MCRVFIYPVTDSTSVTVLSLPWIDPRERIPLPRSRSHEPRRPPLPAGLFLWVIARPARTVGARATGRGASPTCFQTCAGTAWQSASAGKFGQPVARAQVVLQAGFRPAAFRRIAVRKSALEGKRGSVRGNPGGP